MKKKIEEEIDGDPLYIDTGAKGVTEFKILSVSKGVKKAERVITGYASTPHIDYVKDKVTLEALKNAEAQLLMKGKNTVFYNHDTDKPVGKVLSAKTDNKGLLVKVLISKAKDVQDLWTKIKEGIISSFSIRFIPKVTEIEKDDNNNLVSYNINKLEFLELSVVGLPMNYTANITDVVGKSLSSKINKNSEEKEMDKEEKKSLITEIVKEVFGEISDAKMKSSVEAVVAEKLKGLATEVIVDEKLKKSLADSEKKIADLEKSIADFKKGHDELMASFLEMKKSLEPNSQKKSEQQESKEDDKQGKTEIKKSLVSFEDEDTITFVSHVMKDSSEYAKLSAEEKAKAKAFYFQMRDKIGSM